MKLAKLPDRTLIKMSILLAPNLAKRLNEYADFYAGAYCCRQEVVKLVPFMLHAFLKSDSAFKRKQKS
ncbi:protein involved in integration/excision of ICE Tn4371 family [Bradyrhizobium sp. CCBAU 11361]|nr:protein involved in integration/excision of ICE Tn4371 family [Bradyrhizobium sp. CCBAU 11361]